MINLRYSYFYNLKDNKLLQTLYLNINQFELDLDSWKELINYT